MALKQGVRALVEQAMREIETLQVSKAQSLHGQADVVFIDLRDVRELEREGIIPGAFHAPRGMLEFWVDPESPYYKPVFTEDKMYVLFCAAGQRSALATKTLVDMGLPRVAHIEGGFKAWRESGAPVGKREDKSKSTKGGA